MKNSISILMFILFLASSCKVYKQDIMFKLDDNFTASELSEAVRLTEQNYLIQKDDLLSINLFTNKGERIIDPNFELGNRGNNQNNANNQEFLYLVQDNGQVKLPIVGEKIVEGLTLNQAEDILEKEYNEYYKDSFVKIEFRNKRVVVLGANGGQVIVLENENTSIIEVIAQAGGISQGAKANNIRLIRGNLNNPEIYNIDLSTIHGMKNTAMDIEPGDVIYIEPWRRVFYEGLRDTAPIFSLITSLLTLSLVLQNL